MALSRVAATNSASSRSVSPSKEMMGSPGGGLGEELLLPPLGVAGDDGVGRPQDVPGRAVVLLQLDHPRAGVVPLEVEDVADVGAPPLVDRLVLVAHHGDAAPLVREELHQPVLHAVGVLELVDQHVQEPVGQLGRLRALRGEQAQGLDQQAPEVDGVGRPQPLLVGHVGLAHHVVEVVRAGEGVRREPLVLGPVDAAQHLAHREQPLGHLQVGQHPGQQALLVVVVVDDEVAPQADGLAPAAQHARAQGVKGADPQAAQVARAPGPRPQQPPDPLAQLAGGLVGEGDHHDPAGVGPPGQQAGQPVGDHPRLARAGPRDDQQRPRREQHRFELGGVQLGGERLAGEPLRQARAFFRLLGLHPPVIARPRRRPGGGERATLTPWWSDPCAGAARGKAAASRRWPAPPGSPPAPGWGPASAGRSASPPSGSRWSRGRTPG